jgi:hypothetical protein
MKSEIKRFLKSNWVGIPVAMMLSCLILVVLGLSAILLYYPARSVAWHCLNGNTARLGKNTVELPLLWWQETNGEDGSIEIRHARFGAGVAWNMLFIPLRGERVPVNEEAAETWQRTFLAGWNQSGKYHAVPISIVSPRGTIYCMRDRSFATIGELYCRAGGVPWGIAFSGLDSEEREAELILSSLR